MLPHGRHIAAKHLLSNANMLGREYLIKQATTLFRLSKAVRDPVVSAEFLSKAAELEERARQDAPTPLVTPAIRDQTAE